MSGFCYSDFEGCPSVCLNVCVCVFIDGQFRGKNSADVPKVKWSVWCAKGFGNLGQMAYITDTDKIHVYYLECI